MSSAKAIAVIGASGVGKSTCVNQLKRLYTRHMTLKRASTFMDYPVHELCINGQVYSCMDTGADFCKDRDAQQAVIHSHQIFILMYAIDVPDSFNLMESMKCLIQETMQPSCKIIIVGNKLDQNSKSDASVTADCIITIDWELPHVEVSAKYGLNIPNIIDKIFFSSKHGKLSRHRSLNENELIKVLTRRRISTDTRVCLLTDDDEQQTTHNMVSFRSRKRNGRRSSLTGLLRRCTETDEHDIDD